MIFPHQMFPLACKIIILKKMIDAPKYLGNVAFPSNCYISPFSIMTWINIIK